MTASNTFLLKEVIDELLDINKSLVSPLLKLNHFGRLTKNYNLIEYTKKELEGYSHRDPTIPEYRKVVGKLEIDIQFGEITHPRKELPFAMLESPFDEILKIIPIIDSIGVLEQRESELTENGSGSGLLIRPLPLEFIPVIQRAAKKVYKNPYYETEVMNSRIVFNRYKQKEILTTTRSKLLAFAMDIADEFGYDIKIDTYKEKQEKNNQSIIKIMNTTFNTSGEGNVINTGDYSTINATINIKKGNVEDLSKAMANLGIEKEDIDELKNIVREEQPDPAKKTLGSRAITWIGKIGGKALSGVGKIVTSVSSTVLAEYIKQYYGLDN